MEPAFQNLHDLFMHELRDLHSEETDMLIVSKRAIDAGMMAMQGLREYIIANPFKNQQDEISFFKEVKPLFQSRLIYWLKVFHYELNKPTGGSADREAYVLGEQRSLKLFFDHHIDFYRYCRSGATHLDARYFCRAQKASPADLDIELLDTDHQFSSSHSSKLSRLYAHEMFADFLNSELESPPQGSQYIPGNEGVPIHWTASKAGLIELMYAFNSCGVFNHGKASINQIAHLFEQVFHIRLGNYYRTFQEIRIRKKGRTVFLDQLREKVVERMDDTDEHPR